MTEQTDTCPRCNAQLTEDARYCHACGVSITSAASGEWELYDLDRFFNYALDMLCIAGTDGYFKRVNPAFERTLGYSAEELLSKPFVDFIHPDDRDGTATEIGKLKTGTPTLSFENRFQCKDGTYKDFHWTSFPEPGTGLLYAVARDISERRRSDDRIDRLTGLATRRVFEDTLPEEWRRAIRLRVSLAVGLIDVDHFRDYNHEAGLDAGDECLRRLALILRAHVRRAGDLVARHGGQEFALIMQGGVDLDQATAVCERIREAFEELNVPHPGSREGNGVTISAGAAAMVPTADQDHHSLMAAAKTALSRAKELGRNRVVQYAP